jgi:hypothetical protein
MFASRLSPSLFRSFLPVAGSMATQPRLSVRNRSSFSRHNCGSAILLALFGFLLMSGLSAQGQSSAPSVSSLTCASGSVTGAGTDACTVTLTSAAPSGGQTVNLTSSNTHMTVPGSVTVAAGATSANFTATVVSPYVTQTATLTAWGSGAPQSYAIDLIAPSLSSLTCASGTLTGAGIDSCTVTLTAGAPTGGFAVTLASSTSDVKVRSEVSVPGGATSISFLAAASAASSPTTATLTATMNGVSRAYAINLIPQAAPSSLTCTGGPITGAGTAACAVTLTSAAPSGGQTVNLTSSNSSVTVPASVTVASGAASASFTASASAVSTAQTATLTATANGASASAALQLNAYVSTLTVNSSSVAFGSVNLNSTATQSVVLTSTGTAPITVSAATVSGSGFAASGVSFPLTLNPNQTATLEVTFDPTTAGTASGSIALGSNCSMGAMAVSLSGTGVAPSYSVKLSWDAPASSADPVASYDVYRVVSGGSSYTLVGSTTSGTTAYTDDSVSDGTTYVYYVVSVDAEGNESVPSNTYTAAIP